MSLRHTAGVLRPWQTEVSSFSINPYRCFSSLIWALYLQEISIQSRILKRFKIKDLQALSKSPILCKIPSLREDFQHMDTSTSTIHHDAKEKRKGNAGSQQVYLGHTVKVYSGWGTSCAVKRVFSGQEIEPSSSFFLLFFFSFFIRILPSMFYPRWKPKLGISMS